MHERDLGTDLVAFAVAGGHRLRTFDAAFEEFEGLDLLVLGDQ